MSVAEAHVAVQELAAALDDVLVSVVVTPETGTSDSSDWWSMRIDDLGVSACEYGFSATENALAAAVSEEVTRRVECGDLPGPACGLVIRLYLAMQTGRLTDLLRVSQVIDLEAGPDAQDRAVPVESVRIPVTANGRLHRLRARLRAWPSRRWRGRRVT